jgi:hypothetical protein
MKKVSEAIFSNTKNVFGMIFYLAAFLFLDFLASFAIYFVQELIRGYPFPGALDAGIGTVLFRVVSFQPIIQAFLIIVLYFFHLHRNLLLLSLVGFASQAIPLIISFHYNPVIIVRMFYPFFGGSIGMCYALMVSATFAWGCLELIRRYKRGTKGATLAFLATCAKPEPGPLISSESDL